MLLLVQINDYLDSQTKIQLDKGRRIALAHPNITVENDSDDDFNVDIPSDSSRATYPVNINFDFDEVMLTCGCQAYFEYDDCKHCVAAALILQKSLMEKNEDQIALPVNMQKENIDEDGYFHFLMERIDIYKLLQLGGNPSHNAIDKILKGIKPGAIGMPHQCFSYYEKAKKICDVDIVFDGINAFKTRCTCGDEKQAVCKHVIAGFSFIESRYNRYYFSRFKLFTAEKIKHCRPTALSLKTLKPKILNGKFRIGVN